LSFSLQMIRCHMNLLLFRDVLKTEKLLHPTNPTRWVVIPITFREVQFGQLWCCGLTRLVSEWTLPFVMMRGFSFAFSPC
jgi:hypothetical protein